MPYGVILSALTKTKMSRAPLGQLRHVLASFLLLSALSSAGASTAAPVVVLTSYPEELTTAYEKAFEQTHPDTDVQILWQQGRDAMATLSKPDHGEVDVYWAPSLFNFPTLAARGTFEKFNFDRTMVPGRIGAQPISDPNGYFEAFEVAGYGFAVNGELVKSRKLPPPKSWEDLAGASYSGLVVMPVASRIGFSPQLYDIILQSRGWDKGWALLSEMASNADLTSSGGEIIDKIADGNAATAISIDFLVRNAISDGKPVSLVYPNGTAFLPAYVAVVANSPHTREAREFASFALSEKGQGLLFSPGGARYPVRPDVYAHAPKDVINPFALPSGATFGYDLKLGPARTPLISAFFDAALTSRAERLKALWGAIHQAEAKAADAAARAKIAEARQLAGWVPVTAAQAVDFAYLAQFEPQGRGLSAAAKALVAAWAVQLDEKQTEALRLTQSAIGTPAP